MIDIATIKAREDEAKAIQVAWDKLPKGHNSIRATQDWLIEFSEVIKPLILRNREKS